MSKYIRTKDGVYEVVEYLLEDFKGIGMIPLLNVIEVENGVYEKDVIKQADTIKELCDGFYIDELGWEGFYIDDLFTNFDDFALELNAIINYDKDDAVGYGFIQTDKGLKYVAKMNEKGELELL